MRLLGLEIFPYLRALRPYLRKYRSSLIWGYVFTLLKAGFALAVPWLLKRGIDTLESGVTAEKLLVIGGQILAASVISGIFLYAMRWTLIAMSRRLEYDLRNDFFQHMVDLSVPFYQRTRTGDLMARATNDLSAVRDAVGPGIMYSFNTVTTTVASVILMMQLDPSLALWSLAPVPILATLVAHFAHEVHRRSLLVQEQFGDLSNVAQENLAGMRVVQAYSQEEPEVEYFDSMSREYRDRNLSLIRYRSLFTSSVGILTGVGTLIIIWVGGSRVISGAMTLGDLVAFLAYLSLLTWPFISIGWVISVIQRGEAAMQRMLQVWNETPEIVGGQFGVDGPARGEVVLRGVSFAYPTPEGDGPLVLRDVDLRIPAGSTTALVGRTASGKSTVVQLIARLNDATSGSIEVDGVDIKDWDLAELRHNIGMVPQDSFLFSDTLEANLRFGREDADEATIWEALDAVNIRREVEGFPQGLQTRIGERGITLSGGQRQRMSLARALLKQPSILVLDDALSSVDKVTEAHLLGSLDRAGTGRTVILIAHRISTIRHADQIAVLDKGRIVELGTHDELMERDGLYADMARRQVLAEELEAELDAARNGTAGGADLAPGSNNGDGALETPAGGDADGARDE